MERQRGNRGIMTRQDWSLSREEEKEGWAKEEILKSGPCRRAPPQNEMSLAINCPLPATQCLQKQSGVFALVSRRPEWHSEIVKHSSLLTGNLKDAPCLPCNYSKPAPQLLEISLWFRMANTDTKINNYSWYF